MWISEVIPCHQNVWIGPLDKLTLHSFQGIHDCLLLCADLLTPTCLLFNTHGISNHPDVVHIITFVCQISSLFIHT